MTDLQISRTPNPAEVAGELEAVLPPDEVIECVRVLRYRGPRRWLYRTLQASLHGTLIVPVGGRIETETLWPSGYGEHPDFRSNWVPWEIPDEIQAIRQSVDYLRGDETD